MTSTINSPSRVLRDIERLDKVAAELMSTMKRLDRFDREDVSLSIEEAKSALGRTQSWIVDAIQCLQIDHGLETDG